MTGLIHQTTKLVIFCILGIGAATSTLAAPPTPISACPYTISTPGSYAVTQNLSVSSIGGNCISLVPPLAGVSIDLQNHSITGSGTGGGVGILPPHVERGQVRQRDHRQRHDLKVSLCRHFHRGRRQHRFRGDGDSKRRLRRSAWGESRQPHRSRTRYPQASVARPPGRGHHGAEPTAVAGRLGTDQRDLV